MRAVVVGQDGEPALADVAEPVGPGELVRVLACGLCGSDVEKLGDPARAGAVLGHEVVGRLTDGRRVALGHHSACGECDRCRAGHESLCSPKKRYVMATIDCKQSARRFGRRAMISSRLCGNGLRYQRPSGVRTPTQLSRT